MAMRKLAYLFNVSIPMRWQFALDQAAYAIACEEEACGHYKQPMPQGVTCARLWLHGFAVGLTRRSVPAWFVESWFAPSKDGQEAAHAAR